MNGGMDVIKKIFKKQHGQGMVEYAFLIALIAMAVMAAIMFFGNSTNNLYNDSNTHIK